MDTESIKLDVRVMSWFDDTPASGFLSRGRIRRAREIEEFIIDETDDSVRSLGSYLVPSPSDPLISLNFLNFQPDYVYQLLRNQLHDHVLSELIADKIVAEAQRQSLDSSQKPLFMETTVILTQKVYDVVPCKSAPVATDLDQENTEDESQICAICLENLAEEYCQMHNCSHCFHEHCVTEWLNRDNNSCRLCRTPIYEEPE